METSVSSSTASASICDAARRNLRGLLLGLVDGERSVHQRRVELPAQAHDSLSLPGPDRVNDRAAEFVVGRGPEPRRGVYVDRSWSWLETPIAHPSVPRGAPTESSQIQPVPNTCSAGCPPFDIGLQRRAPVDPATPVPAQARESRYGVDPIGARPSHLARVTVDQFAGARMSARPNFEARAGSVGCQAGSMARIDSGSASMMPTRTSPTRRPPTGPRRAPA